MTYHVVWLLMMQVLLHRHYWRDNKHELRSQLGPAGPQGVLRLPPGLQ
jgi:hypothetical protein